MDYTEGKKVKMGQVFREDEVVPVTFVDITDENPADFVVGEKVKITGRSKGRGFQGVVKRHGFAGGPKSHGQKHTLRTPGSIGATGPQRVLPGVKMAGRMGGEKVNLKRVEVVAYEKDRGLLLIKGALPGMRGSKVRIYKDKSEKTAAVES